MSFGGRYLGNDISVTPSCSKNEGGSGSMEHQLLKIHVPRTEADLFGPAFVEVEVLTKYLLLFSFQFLYVCL